MRLIILNQFFYPDHSATSQLMTELAESLVAAGDEVTAIAGRGRYNGGEPLPWRETYHGVDIERAWATSFGKESIARRLCDYLTFYIGALWRLMRVPRHDVVMALTTPPMICLVALIIGRLRGMRVVALVQDIYPDVAVALGTMRAGSLPTRFFEWMNRFVLRGADRIIVLGECMRERIIEKIGGVVPIDVIHNWADGELIRPLAEKQNEMIGTTDAQENPFITENDLTGKFVILFSGNFGRVNEFSTLLEAMRLLREREDIIFLFIGDGAKVDEIKQFISENKLTNVRLLPYQPREHLRYSLTAGDVLVVTLAEGLAGLSVPSKTYALLAAGRPLLFIGDIRSEAARLIAEYECGAIINTGDAQKLSAIITNWASDKKHCTALGRAARRLFEARFERARAVNAYRKSFEQVITSSLLF